jgi:TonB-dependent starch-binding outer membrane protein SusC
MQKFRCRALFCVRGTLIKYLLMTKLAVFFILFFSIQTFAKSYGQEKNISLRLENVQLKKVFKAIENQGFFRFVYKDDALPREQLISISVINASLDEVLGKVLANTPLSYHKLSDNLIAITRIQKQNIQAAPARSPTPKANPSPASPSRNKGPTTPPAPATTAPSHLTSPAATPS